MLREQDRITAGLYGITERMEKMQRELLQIEGIKDVDFDLSGFLSDIPYVIFLPEYDIDVRLDDYFERRQALLREALQVAAENGMTRTEDRIEDMGAHFFIVARLAKHYYSAPVRYISTQRPIEPGSYPRPKDVRRIVNYDKREYIQTIGREAWGYIDYGCVLDNRDVENYELVLDPDLVKERRNGVYTGEIAYHGKHRLLVV